ncbi:MAG TPA: hypothetical protein VK582_21580 [Pyrinomonadaceae bacterium]|nr:hypothetical protein [Pyrinomonadaceae bacterium]
MTAQWHFNQPKPGDKNREPVLGEFFATEAISNAAEALIREGTQNTLDAALPDRATRIRIYISGQKAALAPDTIKPYLGGAWPHITAEGNGLHDRPKADENCSFLLFEDFGSSGLTGDVTQWHDEAGIKNPFYYFFRAEGQSGKGEQDRGRWGVGKTVFPRSSRISAYFGLTVRDDDGKQLLMGQSVLKSHAIGPNYFSPDGYFGLRREDGLTLPSEDSSLIEEFCRDFRLTRSDQSGLSIVVPFADPEINERALVTGVCRDYFYPILSASLEVEVESPDGKVVINHQTIRSVAAGVADQLSGDFLEILELAEWATEQPPQRIMNIAQPPSDRALTWSSDLFSTEQITALRASLQAGERMALRVPLVIRERHKEPRNSFFDVFLVRRGDSESGRPIFIREGIIISDVRSPRSRGILSLVVVEDDPLATLLGDSENPAHTQWQRDSSNYKGKYVYGPSYIQFVVRSVSEIVQILAEGEDKTDPSLLLDLFSLPAQQPVPTREPEQKEVPTGDEIEKPNIPPHAAPRFRVQKVKGGFSVTRGAQTATMPPFLDIRVAYDIRRGNPLRKYDPADFALEALTEKSKGVVITGKSGNQMRVTVQQPDFEVAVSGFDEQRDLFVKVAVVEGFNDSQA